MFPAVFTTDVGTRMHNTQVRMLELEDVHDAHSHLSLHLHQPRPTANHAWTRMASDSHRADGLTSCSSADSHRAARVSPDTNKHDVSFFFFYIQQA